MKYLRKITGKIKWDIERNEGNRQLANQEQNIVHKIGRKQLYWFGHVTRIDQEKLTKKQKELGTCKGEGEGAEKPGKTESREYEKVDEILWRKLNDQQYTK